MEDRRGVGTSRAGLGIGTIVVLGLIGWALGIDPRLLIGGAEMISTSSYATAGAYGTRDGRITRDQVLAHARAIVDGAAVV